MPRSRVAPSQTPGHRLVGAPSRRGVRRASTRPWGSTVVPLAIGSAGGGVYVAGLDLFQSGGIAGHPGRRSDTAAFDASSGRLLPWNPAIAGGVKTLTVAGADVYVGGVFAVAGGRPRHDLAELHTTSGRPLGRLPEPDGTVSALARAGHTLYVAGEFAHLGGVARSWLAAIDLRTGV
jgi:hypothetical protein